jgi:hypothetical protein
MVPGGVICLELYGGEEDEWVGVSLAIEITWQVPASSFEALAG